MSLETIELIEERQSDLPSVLLMKLLLLNSVSETFVLKLNILNECKHFISRYYFELNLYAL